MNDESEQYLLPGVSDWFKDEPQRKEVITDSKPDWPERDIKALEDFCRKYKILGFNCGKMSPIAALALLKRQMGVSDSPLNERLPFTGKKPVNNPDYTYLNMVQQKKILHG